MIWKLSNLKRCFFTINILASISSCLSTPSTLANPALPPLNGSAQHLSPQVIWQEAIYSPNRKKS